MTKDQRPPFLNSQTLKVLVNPAGPHHRARRSGWLKAAKTCSGVAGISRNALKVFISFSSIRDPPDAFSPHVARRSVFGFKDESRSLLFPASHPKKQDQAGKIPGDAAADLPADVSPKAEWQRWMAKWEA
jgi:hypothetical protein